jgi:hypothetical protein
MNRLDPDAQQWLAIFVGLSLLVCSCALLAEVLASAGLMR